MSLVIHKDDLTDEIAQKIIDQEWIKRAQFLNPEDVFVFLHPRFVKMGRELEQKSSDRFKPTYQEGYRAYQDFRKIVELEGYFEAYEEAAEHVKVDISEFKGWLHCNRRLINAEDEETGFYRIAKNCVPETQQTFDRAMGIKGVDYE